MNTDLKRIADYYGKKSQTLKAIEEMAELTQGLLKNNVINIAEEIADVEIMLIQLKYLLKNEELVDVFKEMKIARQITRIEVEDDTCGI